MSSQFNTTTFSTSRNLVSSRDPYRAVNEPKNKEQADKSEKATLVICAHCHQLLNSCFRSQIDHSKEISLDIWSVSILIDNKPGRLNRLLNHHAYLIIEGFSIEGKFWQKAHLMGPGTFGDVRVIRDCYSGFSNNGVIQLTSKKYGYFDLSECRLNRQTWVVSKEKIEKMLLQIQWEQNHPEATPFRFLGEKSFVSMKREFVDTRHPQLIEMENRDKKGFKELCYLFRQKLVLENIKKQKGFITADLEFTNYKWMSFSTSDEESPETKEYYKPFNKAIDAIYKTAVNFRVGGELKFKIVMVRLGFAYYSSPYKDKVLKASKMNLSGGLGYRHKGMFLDLTYVHHINKDVNFPYRVNAPRANTFATLKETGGNVLLTVGFKI